MLILEYKLRVNQAQQSAIDEAIRAVQFIRNKCLRRWMDGRGVGDNDLQVSCAQLAKDYPFAARLNSQARQSAADRAWLAIARFYRQRQDFARKTARALIMSSDMIAYEDLQIVNMVRNHRLAKSISDASWGLFLIEQHVHARAGGPVSRCAARQR